MWTRNPILRWRAVLFVFFFCTLLPAKAQPTGDGDFVVVMLKGTARVARGGAQVFEPLRTNQVVRIGDRVRVSPESQLALRYGHVHVQRYKQLSDFVLEAPPSPSLLVRLNLFAGVANFLNRGRTTDFDVQVQSTSAACRGTEFAVQAAPDGTMTVTVMDGVVDMTNPQAATPLTLTNGQQGVAAPGQAPVPSPALDTINIIQWTLYYPGILDTRELPLSDAERAALDASITSYESGDLMAALASYPPGRVPQSDAERIFRAALLLAVSQVEDAQPLLNAVNRTAGDINARLAAALEQMIAVVKGRSAPPTTPSELGTEWIVESYRQQSLAHLEEALAAARHATEKSPVSGFAWERVAELEFSFGRREASIRALQNALDFSPLNAQAVALNGFLLAARNSIRAAIAEFDRAIALDGALANGWLGRGLCRIRLNDLENGSDDLLIAAALEPQRSFLRSYLGKAWADSGKLKLAAHELELARNLDQNDPTAWLYSALLKQQQNQINDGIRELEHSQDLTTNRALYRSKFLLDQDRAVRSANLAHIYRDAGMTEWSVQEAGRAVSADYANYSAHLFLANSYDELRDPNRINLRYETPAESEYLMANLLAPVGAGLLSQSISQGEYSKLFERNRLGFVSSTEYLSRGAWIQNDAQFGTFGNTGYSLESLYRSDPGQRPNNDLEELELRLHLKQQITPDDSIYLRTEYRHTEAGDVHQYYDPQQASSDLRTKEEVPIIHLGYQHEWQPGVHTLFLFGRLSDKYSVSDPMQRTYYAEGDGFSPISGIAEIRADLNYLREQEIYTAELQQTWQKGDHQVIAGARYQDGEFTTRNLQSGPIFQSDFGRDDFESEVIANQDIQADFRRVGFYLYDYWQLIPTFQLIGGVAYDRITFPRNFQTTPISSGTEVADQFSPKAGFIWTPRKQSAFRFAHTRSVTGASLDQAIQLEPTQVAGLNQSYRSAIPEGIAGGTAGTSIETFSFSLENRFSRRTYLSFGGEILNSRVERAAGIFMLNYFEDRYAKAVDTPQLLDYQERNLGISLYQLVGRDLSFGINYRVSEAHLKSDLLGVARDAGQVGFQARTDSIAVLHRIVADSIYNHPSGFFIDVQGCWYKQHNEGYAAFAGDEFFQMNTFIGYRFPRRKAELRIGILNATDQDYRLNPLNLYNEVPRERTFAARFRFDL